MNLILLEDRDFISPDRVRLQNDRCRHIIRVLGAKPGDTLVCGKKNAKMGTGLILAIDRHSIDMQVRLDQAPPPPLPLTLVLALPRPKMLKRILQNLASLGVKEIYLINSRRVEKSFWGSGVLSESDIQRHLDLGLCQARDTLMPRVHLKRFFSPFVKEELPELSKNKKKILAHPKAQTSCSVGVTSDTVLVIGPEGGFIDLEVQTLVDKGFEPMTIGVRILRVETAVTALISRLFT
ncbi:16S rRNA (uracil(1498)-N(3))-methyltransferase [Desulfobacter hydrogenophilus]|uniref:Ribosomal RNA small subunit methyltransferase E n=1 Tax=Desulfobacter hydrogenophilus TaxID=2291 RepID=A0A328FAX2_9BACT|nr:16S rRNA (uracil(1498)-N(3))-methyltransferase [Desulfobacter hydrogenophilus]NDY74244.1 16S rRNA (uracil(1498)-N(3))-methyltransferase [Desulfobacter hydrogenophilus]QBH14580.1 16S rRNA (uracil(1498)-N(3))-methyltransferase [Desulfobacter hydrogenophilus]RAM00167.1 16S rRNA (uracil(1498)-N(3))-methyltransferase [Desulfobacter hydrogenophilus]